MAFVSNVDDNPKQDKSLPASTVSPSTSSGSGSVRLSSSSAVPGAGGGSTAGATPASSGGQFASLNQYLSANQGQAEPLAGKITAGVGKQFNDLQGQNASTLSGINGQITANGVDSHANDTISQEAANPVSFANDPNNVGAFQKLLGASYSGPASAEGTDSYTKQQNAVNQAISNGQAATQTEAGRANLLKSSEAKPTTGVTALNSAILSKSPTALQSVQDSYKPFSGLLDNLSQGAQAADASIAQNKATADQVRTQSNDQINKQVGDLNKSVADKTAQQQDAVNKYNQNVNDYQTNANTINTSIANFLGKVPLAGVNSNVIGSQNQITTPITGDTVATPEQQQQAAAFQKLVSGLNLTAPTLSGVVSSTPAPTTIPTLPSMQDTLNQFGQQVFDPNTGSFTKYQTPIASTAPSQFTADNKAAQDLFDTLSKFSSSYKTGNYAGNNNPWFNFDTNA